MIPKVMKKIGLILFLLFLYPLNSFAGYDYINISNPFLRKIPIAVSVFKATSNTQEEIELSQSASKLLSDTLEFTGYFKMIDHMSFLEYPNKSGIIKSKINFKNWTGIGAELLITGGISFNNDIIEMELRLFDTFKAKRVLGKLYKGYKDDQRRMIHRFCQEVIFELTGKKGIFDSKIAFVSTVSGKKEIYVCDFDGYNPERVTYDNSIALSPAWSSDGKWLAYTSYKSGKPDLYIKNLKEKRGSIISFKGLNITPAWIPGKFELAATFSFSGDQEIYMLTGTGKIIKRLTTQWGIDVSPSFSPDGKQMAFVSRRFGTPQICIMSLDSGSVRRLTFEGRYNTSPVWSPNGDKIAYEASAKGEINICVINVDGSGLMQYTSNVGSNEFPSWSPDASMIVFCSNRRGSYELYVMNAYGTDQRPLIKMQGEQTAPRWSPRLSK